MSIKVYIQFVLIFCLLTLALFYFYAHYKDNPAAKLYFIWDKTKDLLLCSGIAIMLKGKLKLGFIIFSAFLFIRFIWQLFELENYYEANKPYIIDWLFILCLLSIFFINIISISTNRKDFKRNGRN